MAFTINLGNASWSFTPSSALIPVNGFINPELNKCPHTKGGNPPNSCNSLWAIDFQNNLAAERSKAVAVVDTAVKTAFDDDNYPDAIAALKSLQGYYDSVHAAALNRQMWLVGMRGQSRKNRCCQNNSSIEGYISTARSIKDSAWDIARNLGADIKALEKAEAAFYDSSNDQLDLERVRAEVNYQISVTNRSIAEEGYVTSQLALSEGSGKIIYVVMALVAAFIVYRIAFKK